VHQRDLKSWSDDQDKHRTSRPGLALLTTPSRAGKRPVLPAGADSPNSAMQHSPGISSPHLVPYSHHQKPAAPERPPPGGMR
jgi:hypothetical protein